MGWVYNTSPAVSAESDYPLIMGVSIPLVVLMVLFVCLRLFVRGHMLRCAGADDWILVAGAISSIGYNATTIIQSRWGLGLPKAARPKINLITYKRIGFAGRPFYIIGIFSFKVALCLGYLRILSATHRTYKIVIWITLVACILFHLARMIIWIFDCNPVQKSWQPLIPGACIPFDVINYSLSAITVAFDVIIFFLPIPPLYALQLDRRKKYGILGVFLLGFFTTICSILRMTQIGEVAYGSGNAAMFILWGNIEMNVGIILTCLPVLTPLFKLSSKYVSSVAYRSGGYATRSDRGGHSLQAFSIQGTTSSAPKPLNRRENPTINESQETILSRVLEGADERVERGEILKNFQIQVQSTDKEEGQEKRNNRLAWQNST